jgi:transcriptional regulator with XRE-family HTH domain
VIPSSSTSLVLRFPQAIERLLRNKQVSQKKLALTINMDQSQLSGLVRGHRPPPSKALLGLICNALELTSNESAELEEAAKHDRCIRSVETLIDEDECAMFSQLLRVAPTLSSEQRKGLANYLTQLHGAAQQIAQLTPKTHFGRPT